MRSDEGQDTPSARDDDEAIALRQMYRITADHDRDFETKLGQLLALGRDWLGVEAAFLTAISEGEQLIVEADSDHDLLQPGESCPLSKAYCRKTIDQEAAMTVQHAAVEGWEGDAAYEEFGLESYIGAKVVVDGAVYGTFCFADSEPRDRPFTSHEETYVELMALWVGYEIHQQRARERIQRQRDQMEEFAGVVSHDLRNPLNVAEGRLDLARQEYESEHLDKVSEALDRMKTLIDDMLSLAKAGETVGETDPVDLSDLVDTSWQTVKTGRAQLVNESEATIHADQSRLRQLLGNLLRNAIEHGGPDVTVTVGDLLGGFYVEDDGPGIPTDRRDQIFDPGYTTKEGTGFGLSIVRDVAKAHGWEVDISTGSDGGARFEFTDVRGG